MSLYANPEKNVVKFEGHTVKYYRKIDGKTYSFNNLFTSKTEAREFIKQRKKASGYNNRIVKVGGRFLVYTGR